MNLEVSPAEAAALLAQKKARLIDVREPWELARAAVPGAVAMPMGDIPSRAHQELDPDEPLLLLCHHGVRSLNVAVWMRNQGFALAQSVRGGIAAWASEVDPAVGRY
ncbi:MAG: rhodanese-like domain-containing protein [Terracidiphilus sp.]